MLFRLSNLNSNLALILGYLNLALNNSAQVINFITLEAVSRRWLLYIQNFKQAKESRKGDFHKGKLLIITRTYHIPYGRFFSQTLGYK